MLDLLFPYLGSTVATAIIVVVAVLASQRYRRAANQYESLAQKLPDACRLQNIEILREQAQQELETLRGDVSDAHLVLTQKQDANRWLLENQEKLLSVRAEREEQERIRLEIARTAEQLRRDEEGRREFEKKLQVAEVDWLVMKQRRDLLTEDVRRLETRREGISGEIKELDKQCSPLRQELAGLRAELQASGAELEDARKRLDRSLAAHERQVKQLEVQREAAQTAVEKELDDNRKRLERAQASFDRQIKQMESQRESTRGDLRAAVDELMMARKELGEIQGRETALAAEVEGLEAQRLALIDQLKVLRDDWQYLRVKTGQDEETLRQRTAELWQPVIAQSASTFASVKEKDELTRLEHAHAYLRSLGLRFPQRVLWAFHTSLKVTDISPLVVLAGISGTGKSELPRRYAEAVGLHFLNVAVQPRWDGPQDMFGFFNYLENRYRATELARALIQMDPYHAQQNRGWRTPDKWSAHSLAKHVLLVLLDEMNLARVEYYFSEFLSRLEIRRGVKRDDSQDRRKAEIGLEVGSGGGDTPTMHVFVDRNVLFVGTMNEDETTQTLSDKVVDRTNVLRFGRPGKMERTVADTNGRVQSERLPFSTWQSWCRTESDLEVETSRQVDQWILRLNDALARIRRPFAFRTQSAMRAYVANYPARDPDNVLAAMADQVEQKIFPKFRGLDPRENEVRRALTEVRGVLEEFSDHLLIEAIENTSREHQFVWMGVDRLAEEPQSAVKP